MSGMMHVQVRQEDLTRMDIRKREAMNATRTAFGADYEANLRKEAGPNPEKVARRKHQISSLYHQAKMKVKHIVYPSRIPLTFEAVHAVQKQVSKFAATSHRYVVLSISGSITILAKSM